MGIKWPEVRAERVGGSPGSDVLYECMRKAAETE